MRHELICAWLNLPPGSWPPDHYALLGLPAGETDVALIEQRVHERMERVRTYQLPHPDAATEVMNRLAQALICLTDPREKAAYDAALALKQTAAALPSLPLLPAPPAPRTPPPAVQEAERNGVPPVPAAANLPAVHDGQTTPGEAPVRAEEVATPPVDAAAGPERSGAAAPASEDSQAATPAPPGPPPEPVDPVEVAARSLAASRRGPSTRLALFARIAELRQLIWAWEQVGKYLNRPTHRLRKPAEATELLHYMQVIRQLARGSPARVGQAGQPGYLVLALALQQLIVPTFQTLLPSQREALARDWQAGYGLLRAHRRYLRREVHALRRRSRWRHALRVLGRSLIDHPGMLLLLLGWAAVDLVIPEFRERWWPQQIICLLAVVAVRLAIWRYAIEPRRVASAPPARSTGKRSRRPQRVNTPAR